MVYYSVLDTTTAPPGYARPARAFQGTVAYREGVEATYSALQGPWHGVERTRA